MTQFLIRRIFWAIFLFLVATIITYLIFWVIPADPAALAAGKSATPADVARVRHYLHLHPDRSRLNRFADEIHVRAVVFNNQDATRSHSGRLLSQEFRIGMWSLVRVLIRPRFDRHTAPRCAGKWPGQSQCRNIERQSANA